MKRHLLKIVMFTIVIGILAIAFNTAFGNNTITYLQKIQINKYYTRFYIYKLDFWSYIRNLQLSTTDLSILRFDMPTRQWQTEIEDITQFFSVITNDLCVILDYIIMILNIMLYPLRVGAYIIRNMLALTGVNIDTTDQNNGLAWLVIFVNDILGRIVIPYI